ncbi:Protein F42H11.1 [Aphelenchoides avenae]|nr:Protein F42H11.1 [Aphelenchus avenae]
MSSATPEPHMDTWRPVVFGCIAFIVVLSVVVNVLTWLLMARAIRIGRILYALRYGVVDVSNALRTNALSPAALKILAVLGKFDVKQIELDRMEELLLLGKVLPKGIACIFECEDGQPEGIAPPIVNDDVKQEPKTPAGHTQDADVKTEDKAKTEDGGDKEPVRPTRENEGKASPSPPPPPSTPAEQAKSVPDKSVANFKPPAVLGKAAKNDPNYQTLRGLQDDVFVPKDTPKAPEKVGEKAKAKDPNYCTLFGLNEDIFGPKKGGGGNFKAPSKPGAVDPADPNNQTIAAVPADVFEKERPKKPGFVPPKDLKKADSKDPQYKTLANLDDDVFKKN